MHAPVARPLLIVCAAALLAHATAVAGGFVWLDHAHISDRLALEPLPRLFSAFIHGFAGTGFYRPLMSVSLSLDAATGAGPWLFHLVSALWHAAAAVMTMIAAQVLGVPRRGSFVAALVFAVHPGTSLVASAIAFRSEAMIAVSLLTLIALHVQGRNKAAAIALFLGALCKETALVLGPLFILAIEYDRRADLRQALKLRWRLFAFEATAWVAAVAMRFTFAPPWRAQFPTLGADHAVGMRLAALGKNALLLFFPLTHEVCDAFPLTGATSPAAIAGAAVLVALLVAAVRRRGPALFMAIALLPSLHLVPIMRWWSPHYVYVPLAFAAMIFGQGVEKLATLMTGPRLPWVNRGVAALICVFGLLSLQAGLRYRTDVSLWQPEVKGEPGCREGQFFLAEASRDKGQLEQAAHQYEQAIQGQPGVLAYVDRGSALQNLGVVRLTQKRFTEAAAVFRSALPIVQGHERRQLVHNLAAAELSAGNASQTESLLEEETQRADAMPASLFVRAHALAQLGRTQEANALMLRYKVATQ